MTLSLHRAEQAAADAPLPGMIGEHPSMKAVYRLVRRVAPTDLPVLIVGETGTGKELVARAVHQLSGRRGAFVAFNASAVANTLFEAALFGHVKGGYTGATCDAPGYLLEGHGGTVLFDEIGSMDLASQAKLLRAIETREFRPVGARADRKSDFRVVAATNADLRELVCEGRFRRDLFERLHGVVIALPPLRTRMQDVPRLAASFLARHDHGALRFTEDALAMLSAYHWPGNVRELRQVVDRVAVMVDAAAIAVEDVVVAGLDQARGSSAEELERVLAAHGGDVSKAARALGLPRSTLRSRLKRI